MRDFLASWFANKSRQDSEFIVLSGDHGYALFDPIRAQCPHGFLNVGIMEQSMIGIAAGLAKTGFRPWVYGLASFVPIRVLEQIKLDICYSQLPVVLIGDGAGLVYSTLGASHQCGEDIACLRTLPITILSPADVSELIPALSYAAAVNGPVYLRIGKCDRPVVSDIPRSNVDPYFTHEPIAGSSVVAVSHGSMSSITQKIARKINISAYSIPLLHPFPRKAVDDIGRFRKLIFVDEHSQNGGIASAFMDACVGFGIKIDADIKSLALESKFSRFCGSYQYALSEHGMSDEQLIRRVSELAKL